MIVDTHVHVNAADRPKNHPDVPQAKWQAGQVTGEELLDLMDQGGVDRAVLVHASNTERYDCSYTVDMAARYPDRFSSVCVVNVSQPDAPDRLSYWIEERRMGGVRLFNAMTEDDTPLDDPRCLRVIERAGELQIPVTMVSRHHELDRVRNVLERFSDVQLLLDHLGHMPNEERPPHDTSAEFMALADYPNVSLKFSAVNQWAAGKGPVPPRDYFKAIVDRWGPRRLMWGSNYPPTRFKPYPELARMGPEPFDFLSEEEQRWVFGENALRFWPAPPQPR